ncbi:50S ribosomal protein L4 [Patescibacteria group bacterium]
MAKLDTFDLEGKKKNQITLAEKIFQVKNNPKLIAQAVRVYLNNRRRAKAKTKTRGEVSGSGIKIYRQKGTGRARHGDRYAPIFVGGGVAHGPTGGESFSLKMSRKMKRQALFVALSAKFLEKKITIIEGLDKIAPKTKKMVMALKKNSVAEKKVLLVLPKKITNIARAAKNIKGLQMVEANCLNTYQVLKAERLIFLPEAIGRLEQVFLKKKKG